MEPDRSNYEIWIIDWLDGKLDQSAIDQLKEFLDANPDLREEADSLSLSRIFSRKTIYPAKEDLKKTVSELPYSQIEYLSVAYLENDMTAEQMSDLEQSFDLNQEYKRVFDNIQKIRLTPPEFTYKNKNLLKKQTTGVKAIRFISFGLSAAAAVTLLIISYPYLSQYFSQKNNEPEQIISSAYTGAPFEVRTRIFTAPPEKLSGTDRGKIFNSVDSKNSSGDEIKSQSSFLAVTDTSVIITRPSGIEITVVPVSLKPNILPEISRRYLAATNNNYSIEIYDEERSRISRFIARNFRQKILKDTVINDAPLKSYEIAEAGIEGLNKLLGWEMALVKTSDEEGQVKSIYFSSKVLKFNAPVKKTEPVL